MYAQVLHLFYIVCYMYAQVLHLYYIITLHVCSGFAFILPSPGRFVFLIVLSEHLGG